MPRSLAPTHACENTPSPEITVIISLLRLRIESENYHAADALARMHQVETLVDFFQRQDVGDHRIDLDLAVHVPVDDLGHVGPPARAAEGRALPDAPRDELERPRADLLAGFRDADDDRNAPAAMAGLER